MIRSILSIQACSKAQPALKTCSLLGCYRINGHSLSSFLPLSGVAIQLRFFAKKSSQKNVQKVSRDTDSINRLDRIFADDDDESDHRLKGETSTSESEDIIVDMDKYIEKFYRYMENECSRFEEKVLQIQAGSISPDMFDAIEVSAYGGKMSFRTMANTQVRSSTQLFVTLHDPSLLNELKRSLNEFNSDFSIVPEGHRGLVVTVPRVTMEARESLAKFISERAEKSKKRVRNFRQIAYDKIHKMLKEKDRIYNMTEELNTFQSGLLKRIEIARNERRDAILKE